MALSGNSLNDLIKPDMRDEWLVVKPLWFPRSDSEEVKAYDRRTPGRV